MTTSNGFNVAAVSGSLAVVWMRCTLVPLITSHSWKFDEAFAPALPRMPMLRDVHSEAASSGPESTLMTMPPSPPPAPEPPCPAPPVAAVVAPPPVLVPLLLLLVTEPAVPAPPLPPEEPHARKAEAPSSESSRKRTGVIRTGNREPSPVSSPARENPGPVAS